MERESQANVKVSAKVGKAATGSILRVLFDFAYPPGLDAPE